MWTCGLRCVRRTASPTQSVRSRGRIFCGRTDRWTALRPPLTVAAQRGGFSPDPEAQVRFRPSFVFSGFPVSFLPGPPSSPRIRTQCPGSVKAPAGLGMPGHGVCREVVRPGAGEGVQGAPRDPGVMCPLFTALLPLIRPRSTSPPAPPRTYGGKGRSLLLCLWDNNVPSRALGTRPLC